MRVLITTLFLFFMFVSSIYAASSEIETYEKLSTLEILIIIFVVFALFSVTIAALYFPLIYAFGGKVKLPISRGGWQIWLLIIFALAAIVPSAFLLSPVGFFGPLIVLAVVIIAILFIRRR
jgi:hypothetical protein